MRLIDIVSASKIEMNVMLFAREWVPIWAKGPPLKMRSTLRKTWPWHSLHDEELIVIVP